MTSDKDQFRDEASYHFPDISDEMVKRALLAHCHSHTPSEGPHGETCDEMGCAICNAGPEEAADLWFAMWQEPPSPDPKMYLPTVHLPFDPTDYEEMLALIEECEWPEVEA